MAVTAAALVEHVLVIDRLATHRVHDPHTLDADKLPPEELTKREYLDGKAFVGDALHMGGEMFAAVPFACSCGEALSTDPLTALRKWSRHAGELAGIKAAVLFDHVVVRIAATQPQGASMPRSTAFCSCGRTFMARAADPGDPGQALTFWAEHVARVE